MKNFDFGFINKSNVLIGNIRMVVCVDEISLNALKLCASLRGDYTSVCKTLLVKENAILLRVDNKHFIDIDCIKTASDCGRINELLESKSFDNNIFMTLGTKDPYLGEMYLSDIKTYNEIKESVVDIAKLKLINKDTQ